MGVSLTKRSRGPRWLTLGSSDFMAALHDQDIMIQRLTRLDHDTVKTIFRLARFQMMDQKRLGRLRAQSAQNVEEAALDEWTNAFLKREDEIRAARNCKSD